MGKYDPNKHHRRSIRLKGYDYSSAGVYFVTMCIRNRIHLFGHIKQGAMQLNDVGVMVEKWYRKIQEKHVNMRCLDFVVIPNHFHCIIQLIDMNQSSDYSEHARSKQEGWGEHKNSPLYRAIQWFKTMSTNEYIRGVKTNNWPRFDKKLWQRDYFERIVWNESRFWDVQQYIENNPKNWADD